MYRFLFAPIAMLACAALALADDARSDRDVRVLDGVWKCVVYQVAGATEEKMVGARVEIQDGRVTFLLDRAKLTCRIDLSDDKHPKRLVWRQQWIKGIDLDIEFPGIYSLHDDLLIICVPEHSGGDRPSEFTSTKEDGQALIMLQRTKE